jgi:hypothetical protein
VTFHRIQQASGNAQDFTKGAYSRGFVGVRDDKQVPATLRVRPSAAALRAMCYVPDQPGSHHHRMAESGHFGFLAVAGDGHGLVTAPSATSLP